MNKEQQELLDDAYNRYRDTIIKEFYEDTKELRKWATVEGPGGHTKEEFINKCKTNPEFSKKWGLKIEERELDMMERWVIADLTPNMEEFDFANYMCDKHNVPTKLITVTYKETIIESYE